MNVLKNCGNYLGLLTCSELTGRKRFQKNAAYYLNKTYLGEGKNSLEGIYIILLYTDKTVISNVYNRDKLK